MTDPLSSHWEQPSRELIEIDDKYAMMSIYTFRQLHEYSGTNPTGCYPGKMWRRHDGSFDREFLARGGKPVWMLCWFGISDRGSEWCSNNYRIIILSDANIEEIAMEKG